MSNFPDNIFGINAKEAYDRIMNASDKKPEEKKSTKQIDISLEDYILLPRTSERSDLLIAKNRLVYDERIKTLAERIPAYSDLKNGNDGYIDKISFFEARNLLKELGSFMLNPKLFVEFLNLLRSGNVLDGNKKQIDSKELETISNEIIGLRDPMRAEWLNHLYKSQVIDWNQVLGVNYEKKDSLGNLIQVTEVLDEKTLLEIKVLIESSGKVLGISLIEWLNNPTPQGLPKINVGPGDTLYWPPKDGKAVGFCVDSKARYLQLDLTPDMGKNIVGVREAKIYRGSQ